MDTITYNLDTQKAKIKGVATQQGDGWLVGGSVKKMPDNTFNIEHGKYTTCDQTDHPHFYLAMTKAKVIPGKKVVTGPAYLSWRTCRSISSAYPRASSRSTWAPSRVC